VIGPSDKETEILVNAVCEGLKAGHAPQLISEGEVIPSAALRYLFLFAS
jgi:hypothetical protein